MHPESERGPTGREIRLGGPSLLSVFRSGGSERVFLGKVLLRRSQLAEVRKADPQ